MRTLCLAKLTSHDLFNGGDSMRGTRTVLCNQTTWVEAKADETCIHNLQVQIVVYENLISTLVCYYLFFRTSFVYTAAGSQDQYRISINMVTVYNSTRANSLPTVIPIGYHETFVLSYS